MAILNENKALLLDQVKKNPKIGLETLVSLLKCYEDLKAQDFKGYISDILYNQLLEADRDPQELELWNRIQAAPRSTPAEVQDAQRLVSTYMTQFPQGLQKDEMPILMEQLERRLNELIEEEDWKRLDRNSYNALQEYKKNYPNSVHLSELDDLMWEITRKVISRTNVGRYLNDWDSGRHTKEASQALDEFDAWEKIKYSDKEDEDELLFEVASYRSSHPDSWLRNEVTRLYNELREKELKGMKANPSKYKKDRVDRLIAANIFTKNQLIAEELLPQDNRGTPRLKDLRTFQLENPNIKAPEGCTDVYLFGTPGAGKTCLLMGLLGADGTVDSNGNSYTINTKKNGGPYAAALQEYVEAGITPGRTYGSYVTTISGVVTEKSKKGGNIVNHQINLVEMSGEEFAIHIAGNEKVALADMGTGATNLLRNKNRKVFFIVIDPTALVVKFNHMVYQTDGEGNVIGQELYNTYVNQKTVINQFASLFSLDENQDIMKYVDAIHFIVTKADMLGERKERLEKAREILLNQYGAPVQKLINYCRQSKRINYSTNYRPHVFTFSLGRFYLGDIFDFDKTETLEIVDTIRAITGATNEVSWWDKLMQAIGD